MLRSFRALVVLIALLVGGTVSQAPSEERDVSHRVDLDADEFVRLSSASVRSRPSAPQSASQPFPDPGALVSLTVPHQAKGSFHPIARKVSGRLTLPRRVAFTASDADDPAPAVRGKGA